MALNPETGVGLPDADSLVSLAEVRAYAGSRGEVLPVDDTTVEQQIRKANDYVAGQEMRFQGTRATAVQALSFPRKGVSLYGTKLAIDIVPTCVKNAIAQLVVEQQTRDIMPTADGRVVLAESVGPLSTTYQNTGTTGAAPSFPRVDALLLPLLRNSGGILSSTRV